MENNEFGTLMQRLKDMHNRYYKTIHAFYAYEALREVIAPNIVGEHMAHGNVEVFNKYKNFFLPAKESLKVYFFLELAKLFDASKQSLHINKIINFTESNIENLTVDAFQEYNQDRELVTQLIKEYKGMSHKDLTEIRNSLTKHQVVLEKLEDYRNKWLVHDDLNKPEIPSITGEEIKSLLEIIEKILNSFTGKLNSESWLYSYAEDETKSDVRLVIDHLRRFEPYRIKEIEDEYKENLKKFSV